MGDAWVAGRNGASACIAKVSGARTIIAADPTVIVIATMDRRMLVGDALERFGLLK